MIRTFRLISLAVAACSAAVAQNQPLDHLALGKMWTFENPPLAYLEEEYGFKPDQKWLDSLRLGALRLGERDNPWCSASFVSPKGLIMTNHHCIRDNVAKLGQSIGQPYLVDESYGALSLEDELKLEDLTVHQLLRQQDVTDRVNEGVEDDDGDIVTRDVAIGVAIYVALDAASEVARDLALYVALYVAVDVAIWDCDWGCRLPINEHRHICVEINGNQNINET